MQNEQQFQQLILQYKQLINGAKDIALMIQQEDFDNAITMVKTTRAGIKILLAFSMPFSTPNHTIIKVMVA